MLLQTHTSTSSVTKSISIKLARVPQQNNSSSEDRHAARPLPPFHTSLGVILDAQFLLVISRHPVLQLLLAFVLLRVVQPCHFASSVSASGGSAMKSTNCQFPLGRYHFSNPNYSSTTKERSHQGLITKTSSHSLLPARSFSSRPCAHHRQMLARHLPT